MRTFIIITLTIFSVFGLPTPPKLIHEGDLLTSDLDGSASGSGSGDDLFFSGSGSGGSGSGGYASEMDARLDPGTGDVMYDNNIAIHKLAMGKPVSMGELGGLVVSVQRKLTAGVPRQTFVDELHLSIASYFLDNAEQMLAFMQPTINRLAVLYDYLYAKSDAGFTNNQGNTGMDMIPVELPGLKESTEVKTTDDDKKEETEKENNELGGSEEKTTLESVTYPVDNKVESEVEHERKVEIYSKKDGSKEKKSFEHDTFTVDKTDNMNENEVEKEEKMEGGKEVDNKERNKLDASEEKITLKSETSPVDKNNENDVEKVEEEDEEDDDDTDDEDNE